MAATDWGATGLGDTAAWPQSVRAIIRMMLTSRYAMWLGWGPDLAFIYNDAYARMTLGAKHPWALGKPAREVWAEIWADIGPRIEHVLATGEATWDEGLLLFLERSGFPEETYHTFSYSPLYDDEGEIGGMFCVVTEVTDRLIGERRLALLRDLASHLASSKTTEDVWEALERSLSSRPPDLPFTLTVLLEDEASPRIAAATNLTPGAPVRARAIDLTGEDAWPIRQVLEDRIPRVVELPRSGTPAEATRPAAPTHAMLLPITQQAQARAAGVFVAALNPHRPIDSDYESFLVLFAGQLAAGLANAQAYAAERRRSEALAQIDHAKTIFFSNVSHEFRTPLTLMLGPVADALAAPEPRLDRNGLELVHRNGVRLRRLVNALLDFSRIEAGRMNAVFEPVDLGEFTAELASAFRSAVERAGLRLVVDVQDGHDTVYIDRDMWEKVVLNLLSNAFKFTFDGQIAVRADRRGDHVRLVVRDTGVGIAASELPRLFERFHRVEGTRGRTHEGTGIGLALVHELVKLHGGAIEVESEPGKGTAFTILLPLGTAHLPAERIGHGRRDRADHSGVDAFAAEVDRWLPSDVGGPVVAHGSSLAGAAPPAGSPRILLADDNADMRAYLASLLGQRWAIEVATNGREAVALARRNPPDLIVTDVMMPVLDGFGVLAELRADERTRDIPVVMLSARAGEEARLEGIQSGADDYVTKPFTARELVVRIEAQLLRSHLRRVEERSARRMRTVFAHAPVPIAILRGPTHVFELANDSYLAVVAHRPVVGRPVIEALPELESQGIIGLLDRVYATGEPYVGRSLPLVVNRGPNGAPEQCYFDFVYQPLFDEAGAVEGIAAVVYEVSELASARQSAESANRAKDEFLAMLGHELRNPLAPILTALQLLRLRGIEAGERERTIIERQVRHLVGLVDDLLDVSRITRGKVRISAQPVETNELVAKAIEQASPLLEQHRHNLEVDVPRHGLGVLADPARLAQVVANLLTNAAKYTPPGGEIRVSARAEGDEVVLSVRDSGIGIDPDMLPRIFELFSQDRQAIDRAQGGLGLGLAIVQSLVALHGGTVSARSDGPGRGSEFMIRLARIALPEEAAAPGSGPATPVELDEPRLRVLIVDDNPDAAAMLSEALRAAGHITAAAHDGPAALELAARFSPHVALLDIGLPVMDGFELAHQFAARAGLRDTKLVAVTGYGQDQDRRRSIDAGFAAHLVKPVDLDDLTRLIEQLAPPSADGV